MKKISGRLGVLLIMFLLVVSIFVVLVLFGNADSGTILNNEMSN